MRENADKGEELKIAEKHILNHPVWKFSHAKNKVKHHLRIKATLCLGK